MIGMNLLKSSRYHTGRTIPKVLFALNLNQSNIHIHTPHYFSSLLASGKLEIPVYLSEPKLQFFSLAYIQQTIDIQYSGKAILDFDLQAQNH